MKIREEFVSNQPEMPIKSLNYDQKKQYIEDKVLSNSTVMEKLFKFNENKL